MSKNKKNSEPTEVPSSETEVQPEPQSPEQRITELEKEVSEWKDKYLRSMAEFDNFRRRSIQEKADWIRLATEKMALNVCDVVDNFERALLHFDEASLEDKNFKGILLIEQQLRAVLEKENVKRIEALGAEFDPTLHEALAHIASEYEENKVAAIIQNGYTMHDKLIRPVRVAVSNGTNNNKALEE
ncbi:MAG: nucleotide exchange factor GrpE [Candidatus Cloacimonetes bacterium HGW-Cloacimonetes-1]|jgi:molecular chaperone GrpE|nr:MAG: nucleotide exchange factor GrpE [Candidatus Cloacimonetes bacterium HGW-Cloacimonetes-1]